MRASRSLRAVPPMALALLAASAEADDREAKLKPDNKSFTCTTDMTKVRHFHVHNLAGNLDKTVKVATAGGH